MHPGQWIFWREICAFLSLGMIAPVLFAAVPANDNYSNRFAIVSSPMVVTTSLAGATLDPSGPEWSEPYPTPRPYLTAPFDGSFYYPSEVCHECTNWLSTLWWGTLTLTNPSSLTVEILEAKPAQMLTIWHHELTPSTGGVRRVSKLFAFSISPGFATARLTNGHPPLDLDVQLARFPYLGEDPGRAVLRFTVHTNPLILIPPQSRTVSAGESVFFGVQATGHSDLQYQWLHNGEALAGANFPLLSLDHVTSSNAGTYRVVLTDDLGTNSAEVTLTVSETNVPPVWHLLKREATNQWSGSLEVEAGRSYRIETSMTLTNWTPLTNLTQESSMAFGTAEAVSNGGIVFLPNINSEVRFQASAKQQYFRAVRYESANSECHNNLKKIRFIKDLWRVERKRTSTETPSSSEIFGPAFYQSQLPVCPSGGVYTINPGYEQPQCSIHSPLLEPSW
jgi:hypothetical protein